MKIVPLFLDSICDKCPHLSVDTDLDRSYSDAEVTDTVIRVTCAYKAQCSYAILQCVDKLKRGASK